MIQETQILAPKGTRYLSEIPNFTEIPLNCLFNKARTGCGATELAIRNDVPTLIAMPTIELVRNKTENRPDGIEVLGVYGGVSNRQIKEYLDTHSC